MDARTTKILTRVRALCLALPAATERTSHGSPCFFIGKSPCFAMFTNNHHGDGRTALWLAAPPGVAAMLIESEPDHYFYPPYVGPSGWVGVRLDRAVTAPQLAALIEGAHAAKLTSKAGRRPVTSNADRRTQRTEATPARAITAKAGRRRPRR